MKAKGFRVGKYTEVLNPNANPELYRELLLEIFALESEAQYVDAYRKAVESVLRTPWWKRAMGLWEVK